MLDAMLVLLMPTGTADDRILTQPGPPRPLRVLGILCLATALAALLTSAPLLAWTETLPDGALPRLLHGAAVAWNGAMQAMGATKPHAWLRALVRWCEARQF